MIREQYPKVTQWIERCHNGEPGATDRSDWLDDDEVPATVTPLLQVFFTEMWPVLVSTCDAVAKQVSPRSSHHL
jgi:hypothetical protein